MLAGCQDHTFPSLGEAADAKEMLPRKHFIGQQRCKCCPIPELTVSAISRCRVVMLSPFCD